MSHRHIHFWIEQIRKVGRPIFAGTFVACLVSGIFELIHSILMAVGLTMIGFRHWKTVHS